MWVFKYPWLSMCSGGDNFWPRSTSCPNCPNCPTNCRDPRMINAKPSDRERDKKKKTHKTDIEVRFGCWQYFYISGFPSLYRINHPNFVMIPLMIPSLHWEDSSPKFSESCQAMTHFRFGFGINIRVYPSTISTMSVSLYHNSWLNITFTIWKIPWKLDFSVHQRRLFPRRQRVGSRLCLSFLFLRTWRNGIQWKVQCFRPLFLDQKKPNVGLSENMVYSQL